MNTNTVLEFKNIVKRYPGVLALNDVSITFREGEVHALVGENGAGKSTLIKTSTGAIAPTAGTIIVNGKEYSSFTPITSRENGIAVIYQEFNLVNDLSVAENVFLGNRPKKNGLIDMKTMVEESHKIFNRLGIEIDTRKNVRELTTGYQQLVEIAKALSCNTKILIMDEPSASLTTNEVEMLFRIVKQLQKEGVTIIYISHRLDEIFEISDRVSVLRDGQMIKTMNTAETNRQELISLMVGRDLKENFPVLNANVAHDIVMEVQHLAGPGVKDASFQIRKGEILGMGGLIGAGRTETAQIICGVSKKTGGKIIYNGKEIHPGSPKEAINMGIALAPEDRKKQGVMLHMSIAENIVFPSHDEVSRFGILDNLKASKIVEKFKDALRIKTPSVQQLVRNLSGGNQQKVVLAKWLAKSPDVIILDEPTRGIDVGAKQEIYGIMKELAESGKAVIMISSDMEELLGMSSRIVVFCEGRTIGELKKEEFSQEAVLTMASAVQ